MSTVAAAPPAPKNNFNPKKICATMSSRATFLVHNERAITDWNKNTTTGEVRFSRSRAPRPPPVVKKLFLTIEARSPQAVPKCARSVRMALPRGVQVPVISRLRMYWPSDGSLSPPVLDRASTRIRDDGITSRCLLCPGCATLPWPHFSKNACWTEDPFPSKP